MTQQLVIVDHNDVCGGGLGARYNVEYKIWGSGSPEIVLLHDGLGSIAQWRDTPATIAERSGKAVVAYNRPGHGGSLPVPTGPWPTRWLHHQSELLGFLMEALGIDSPLLVGHSDGGSIALLYSAPLHNTAPHGSDTGVGHDQPTRRCRAVVALAAHSFVESICTEAIAGLRASEDDVLSALDPFHAETKAVFDAWSGVWLSTDFADWDIRTELGSIEAPTWIVQGSDDEYGSLDQLWTTVDAVGSNGRAVLLNGRGHLLHHEDSDAVVEIVLSALAES